MIRATLEELDLGELLKALEVGRKSAVVSFQGQVYGRVHLLSGRILYARTEPGPHLGEYLVRLGHLSLEEVQSLVERQGQVVILAESGVVRRLLLYLLEAHRYRVLLARDLEGLMRLLKERPKGIVLQGERALEAARRVRAQPRGGSPRSTW